jgi:hypothetical protein
MVPIWMLTAALLGNVLLLVGLIRRESTWFHRHDALQDKHIALLKGHEDLRERYNSLMTTVLRHND